jgi:amino acid transporter
MENLTLITPSVLFSATSLILLAYTNRFHAYAQLIRTLKDKYMEDHSAITRAQIVNMRKRLYLTQNMQLFGVASLLLSLVSMFFIYIGIQVLAEFIFGVAMVSLITSLSLTVWEIRISVKALNLHLSDMENGPSELQ